MNNQYSRWQHVFLIVGIVFIALNLRPAISGIGPLAERMTADGLSRVSVGMLTTVPLILFGIVSIWAGWIGTKVGFARALGLGLALIGIGCLVRSFTWTPEVSWRLTGTVLIGCGIALGNVLLPGLVKSRYPQHIGVMTSIYATGMNLGAASGVALAVPMANAMASDWRGSLSAWGIFALAALVFWSPQLMAKPNTRTTGHPLKGVQSMMRKRRAWQIMIFMGLQSTIFYSAVAWLPTVLQDRGMTEIQAAGWASAMQLIGCAVSLFVPTLAGKSASQSRWVLGCSLLSAVGITGILVLPLSCVGISTLLLGLGLNAGFGLVLLILALRSKNPETAAGLSSFAQAGGYLLSAPGPWLLGLLSTTAGGWPLAYGLLIVVCLLAARMGYLAGKTGELDVNEI